MKTYELSIHTPMTCFYIRSENFPSDAKNCHIELHSKVSFDANRHYLGLSKFKSDGSIEYLAACTELHEGELAHTGLEKIELVSVNYLCSDLENYMEQIDKIGVIFSELVKDNRFNPNEWAIEWYKQDVCICMIPLK